MSQCNGTIKEASEGDSSITDQVNNHKRFRLFHKNELKMYISIFFLFFNLQGSSVDEEEDQEIDLEGQSPEGQSPEGQKDGQNLDDSGQASGTGRVKIVYSCKYSP